MQLDKVVSWYQKKISTYDKQQWEKTVEQRILAGFVHVPLKNTELKKELIDVDLVRGSSFPKAKPKQGLTTVLKLALLRYLLLPLYARWWVRQTSPKIFSGLLVLYTLQLFNLGVYSYNVHRIGDEDEVRLGDGGFRFYKTHYECCLISVAHCHAQRVYHSDGARSGAVHDPLTDCGHGGNQR